MCFINKFMVFLEELSNIKKNVVLAPYTTFKIGGPAKYFYVAKSNEDLIKAVKAAKKADTPFFILGAGSNVLVSDKGFNGLVIKIQNTKYRAYRQAGKILNTKIIAEAGTNLGELVNESIKSGLTGLEWAAGIPGTIGGAVRGNAGSQKGGSSIGELVEGVTLLNSEGRIITVDKNWMQFDYRHSRLKDIAKKERPIILSVVLKLEKGDVKKIKQAINEQLTTKKQNIPGEPSAGCIFKNPEKYPAGYLIEQCGLKGKKIKGVMISQKHANFIVNVNSAKAKDVKKLINLCKEKVKEKFGTELEEEIEYVGDF